MLAGSGLPVLPALLQPPRQEAGAELSGGDTRLQEAQGFVDSYGLNDDQAAALKSTAGWFAGKEGQVRQCAKHND